MNTCKKKQYIMNILTYGYIPVTSTHHETSVLFHIYVHMCTPMIEKNWFKNYC